MDDIQTKELEIAFARGVRNRHIDQKFLYLDDFGAKNYYAANKKDRETIGVNLTEKDYFEFLKDHINKKDKIALISLGCGNASLEKLSIKKLSEEGYQVKYIGVDISKPMLDLAEENLKDVDIEKHFVETDIVSEDFKEEIKKLTKTYDKRIFAFIGGTLGNVNQTNIADTLYNLLAKNDILWLDVRVRPDASMESNMKLFNRYASFLENKDKMNFYFHPLGKINVPYSSGTMNLMTTHEKSVGALLFTFYFKFDKKVVINLNEEKVHFLPNEEIKLLSVRVYHPDTLINFFEGHEFQFTGKQIKSNRGEFIFTK